MNEKVALVTGANKGIGFEIARQLAARGITVLSAARDAGRGRAAAAALGTHDLRLDVTDGESVAAAAKRVEADFGRLDILVNNAAITDGRHLPPSETSVDTVRDVYETNVFGVIRVTNALLPLLRRSPAGRIVNVSSGLGSLTQMSDPEVSFYGFNLLPYNTSKTALNAVTLAYAKELAGTPVKVNLADPGYTATDLNGHTGERDPADAAVIAVRLATLDEDGPTGTYADDAGPVPW